MIMVLMFYLRHNLSMLALNDLLLLINSIAGSNVLPKSTYLFKKLLPKSIKPEFNFFCPNCFLYLDKYEKTLTNCPNCNSNINFKTDTGKNFFVSFKIEDQVRDILERNFAKIGFKKKNDIEN
jgi:hypothetical protein